jgi:hypothetical protein
MSLFSMWLIGGVRGQVQLERCKYETPKNRLEFHDQGVVLRDVRTSHHISQQHAHLELDQSECQIPYVPASTITPEEETFLL